VSDAEMREVVTIDGKNITIKSSAKPVENNGLSDEGDALLRVNAFDPALKPENYSKADGAPLRLFDATGVKVDVSKRSKEDMGFWHRNVDAHEIIFCVRGALGRETELGTVTLHEGEMILIPRGITHRSFLVDESAKENILLELKISGEITYTGPDSVTG